MCYSTLRNEFPSSYSWFYAFELVCHLLTLGDDKSITIYVREYPVRLHIFGDSGLVCIDNSIIRFKLVRSEDDNFATIEDLTYSSLSGNWKNEVIRLRRIERHLDRLCWGTWYVGHCEENMVISHD